MRLTVATLASHEESADHRDHRTGWLVPRRAAAGQGIRGPWPRPPLVELQHRSARPRLPRSARARRADEAALRRPDRVEPAREARVRDPAGRGLPPRRAEPRTRLLR